MPLFTPGWLTKALHLRTTVSCAPVIDLPQQDIDWLDGQRILRKRARGILAKYPGLLESEGPFPADAQEFMDAVTAHAKTVEGRKMVELLHEPAQINGWHIDAALYGRSGVAYWLVHVTRPTRKYREPEFALLVKIMNALGCDDLERDQISINGLADLIEEGIPVMYTWRNTIELQEIQLHKSKLGKGMMRIVPRGSRASDGYEKLDLSSEDLDR